jgi:hypothetical protein
MIYPSSSTNNDFLILHTRIWNTEFCNYWEVCVRLCTSIIAWRQQKLINLVNENSTYSNQQSRYTTHQLWWYDQLYSQWIAGLGFRDDHFTGYLQGSNREVYVRTRFNHKLQTKLKNWPMWYVLATKFRLMHFVYLYRDSKAKKKYAEVQKHLRMCSQLIKLPNYIIN